MTSSHLAFIAIVWLVSTAMTFKRASHEGVWPVIQMGAGACLIAATMAWERS